ncbi:class I SAM-dependent methyltransferase [Massilia sp. BJB1822]|uniref:class I SAM-dependent methyltransferase n=1 Tax=Massilia sp. BJB1822 TaxID=2744470 RepID=UPI0015931EA5|nr:class I SAM-dependent methyltransferase [Massilia sp. BJB1822]NVD96923.1 class I SAM-dependent methyltransferase [Massilia sp. BJB1822]
MPDAAHDSPYGDFPRSEMRAFVPASAQCVLDVGCHTGAFGLGLKQRGVATVWGVEANPATAAIAARRLDKVIPGYFTGAEVPDGFFDAIVFNDVLEHMPDPAVILRAAAPKLKAGGVVVASIPNVRHIDNLVHMLKEKDFRYEAAGVRDATHLRFYTLKSIPRLFEQAGYAVDKLEGINESWWTPSLLRRLAFRFFSAYFSDTRFIQYAVVARPVAAVASGSGGAARAPREQAATV